jgi:hypothetical protein
VTKRRERGIIEAMSPPQKAISRHIAAGTCARCAAPLPTAATTGRPRVYCSPACRKAAYDDRRARKPGAFQVRLVERTIVETVETTPTVQESHDIAECARRVAGSPRAVTNILGGIAAQARAGALQLDPRWGPVARAIAGLNRALFESADRERRYPRR